MNQNYNSSFFKIQVFHCIFNYTMAYRPHKLIEGFEKANSDNLPEVDIVSLGVYIAKDSNFISPEISNIKAIRNGRESYGEQAIGYVQC